MVSAGRSVSMVSENVRTIVLLDIDCFFASVEMALHPELRGKPLCIGGHRGDRGIVACPNYEARAYGVKTAMPLRTASKLLPPDAAFLPGSHRRYGEYSERVMKLLYDFTPDIEQVSIDEAYMDVTGCLHFWMKERIWKECGLGVSIGIASN
jgi:DNA polymerase-4